jgi:hypothetical protein
MGKAAAVTVLGILMILVVWAFVTVVCRAVYGALWQRAVRTAQWKSHVEMTGSHEATVTVRRVARLGWRQKVLQEFAPEDIRVDTLGDSVLLEAVARADEQADLNNRIGLGRD